MAFVDEMQPDRNTGRLELLLGSLTAIGPLSIERASRVAFATACVLSLVTWQSLGGAYALEACLFVLISVLGFVGPNSTALALEHHGQRAGVASSVLGAGQFGLAAAASAAVSAFSDHGPFAMGAVVAAAATLCLLAIERPRS